MELWEYLKASIYGETFDWIPLTWPGEATGGTSRVSYIHCRTNQNANPQHVWHPRNSSSHHSAATWTASFFSSSRCVFGKCPQALSLRWAQTHKKNYRLTTATFSPWQVAAGYSGALSSSQVDVGLCFLSGHCELHPLNNDGIGQGECVVLCGKICSVASYQ